jgi:para-nitrobenzyl esterase
MLKMENEVIVEIKDGKIKGYGRRGVIKFKGIPYATPPIGDLRFQPPDPVKPWSGVFDATKYSPVAPQPESNLETMFGELPEQSEKDCLTLNVWTKKISEGKRPVMFWIHGGGFVTGNGGSLDGSRLVLRGDVVVVSINYRLGPLGFLYIPGLTANVGLLDMVKALEWTRDNVSLFGGDPENVTIFGESAGGFAVASLLALPSAKGLFHKAITQSGAAHPLRFNESPSIRYYETLIEELGIEKGDIKSLKAISAEKIIKAHQSIVSKGTIDFTNPRSIRLGPVVDKNTMPIHPLEAVRNGYIKDIALFVGSNKDETKLWNIWNPNADKLTEDGLFKGIKRLIQFAKQESKANDMIEIYKQNREIPRDITDAITTDYSFRIPSIRLAEAQSVHQKNTFMYLFSWANPMNGGKYGAMHALELPFVFGLLGNRAVGVFPKRTEITEALSNNMMDCWINFARSGNPNHGNIPKLPAYESDNRFTIVFDKEIAIEKDPFGRERAAWDRIM